MIKCFLGNDYKNCYSCEYEYQNGGILLRVDYDIEENELDEASPGVKLVSVDTNYDNRDIVVLDVSNKKYFLLKNARCNGYTQWDLLNSCETRFYSKFALFNKVPENLFNLDVKISQIKIISKTFNKIIGNPSLSEERSNDGLNIKLDRNIKRNTINIDSNNIKSISLSDDWNHLHSYIDGTININVQGCLQIELINPIDYTDIQSYLNELMIYMQLYVADSFVIDEVLVNINGKDYQIKCPFPTVKHRSRIEGSLNVDILDFLGNCYKKIPYRNNDEIRNLFYILVRISESLEDNFLICYKFIDFYYEGLGINHPIEEAILKDYDNKSIDNTNKYAQEIVDVRNHFVHDCYYVRDEKIEVKHRVTKKVIRTVEGVNPEWIFERTKVLFKASINIVFKRMLGYEEYTYPKEYI